jgi:hypothetical protein
MGFDAERGSGMQACLVRAGPEVPMILAAAGPESDGPRVKRAGTLDIVLLMTD